MIIESIITSLNADGSPHIAPFGIREVDGRILIAPFRPSASLDNLLRDRVAVVNFTDDVRVYAGALTGRRVWPTKKAETIAGWVLNSALTHLELVLDEIIEDELRPKLYYKIKHEVQHSSFRGFNRAQAAVIEAAVLVSRLSMLPADKINAELQYLKIAIEKTAGPREAEAWRWLMERIENFQAEQSGDNLA
jgi:hypothetical protein